MATGSVIENYRIQDKIGVGGMADDYKMEDTASALIHNILNSHYLASAEIHNFNAQIELGQ